MRPLPLLLALLAACGDKGDVSSGDEDGDGFEAATDCDDLDASVNPDATERCNGVDDDCDGEVDEADAVDASAFYADADADGFGDPGSTETSCAPPANVAEVGGDCDDHDADIHPGATEHCDGVDEDCDGEVDGENAVDPRSWSLDADGDGYGDPDRSLSACLAPSGAVADDTDCDDGDASVHPGATESCNELDDDCDGEVDEDATDGGTWYPDADHDGFGDPDTPLTACSQPEGAIDDATDCDDSENGIFPGAKERCNGVDDDCDGVVDEDEAVDATTWYVDADSDGYGDPDRFSEGCSAAAGEVALGSDCDDGDDSIYPGATEQCNGVDDDCDASTSEADTATFTDSAGAVTSMTSTLTGTRSKPAVATLSTDGTLSLCEGTWYVNLDVSANVALVGYTGDPADVLLDAGSDAPVVDMYTDGISVSLTDLTLQGGAGSVAYYPKETAGGGIACYSAAGTASLDLDGVILDGNDADYGGGLWIYDCTVSVTDTEITGNTGTFGAGVALFGGQLTMDDVEISGNSSDEDVGGMVLYDVSGNGADATLTDVAIKENSADNAVGGLAVIDAYAAITGNASSGIGITDNSDGGLAGLYLSDGGEVDLTKVDLGTSANGDNNDPYDIYVATTGYFYFYDDNQTVSCTDSLCGTESSATISSATTASAVKNGARGNIFSVSANGTIDEVEWYLATYLGKGCSLYFYVLSASSSTASTWTVEWSAVKSITNTGFKWVSSGDVGVPVVVGKAYANVLGWSCSSTGDSLYYVYDTSGSSSLDMGFGTTSGRWLDSSTGTWSAYGSTVSSMLSSDAYRYYTVTSWSH